MLEDDHLSYFPKLPPKERFAALGSENGLLILAEMNRNWFPTNFSAEKFRMEIINDTKNNTLKI